jgi:hypothetical protein
MLHSPPKIWCKMGTIVELGGKIPLPNIRSLVLNACPMAFQRGPN